MSACTSFTPRSSAACSSAAGLLGLDEHDAVAGAQEAHSDAAAHEPRTDDAHRAHRRGEPLALRRARRRGGELVELSKARLNRVSSRPVWDPVC
eukprot:scaffold40925_cov51-Phaeocystis_antarctica.AAC.1